MFPKPIQDLIEHFRKFPGVGPRQAARFAFYLLREEPASAAALARSIAGLHAAIKLCSVCYRTFAPPAGTESRCEICRNPSRNARQILVVEKEVDMENIERTGNFSGLYHVLGGTINPLDSTAPARLHLRELFARVQELLKQAENGPGVELILGTNPTTEGDATALYMDRVFLPLKNQFPAFTLSRLGRGLGTGAELEYADDMTIANALKNRK
ncbi:recombination protein RecR [Candidatus Parcubacteria bacterium]|nr:MAG: recombination protein RecR [Candidatus Parcubacteria bacterium]